MPQQFEQIDRTIARIVNLAADLRADPDGHVRRSVQELRDTFETRGPVEPAVSRVRESLSMLQAGNQQGLRREFQRRAPGVDQLSQVVEQELLPDLRRLGFDL